jgi:cytochrome c550
MIRGIRTTLLAAATVLAIATAVGCGKSTTVLNQDANGSYAAAVKLYQDDCITCHGDNLQGGIGPNLQHVGSKLSQQAIAHQIDVGGGPMPGYGPDEQQILTTAEIKQISDWLAMKK